MREIIILNPVCQLCTKRVDSIVGKVISRNPQGRYETLDICLECLDFRNSNQLFGVGSYNFLDTKEVK